MSASGSGRVRSVISGDTLVLSVGPQYSEEKQLSLAFVTAPRLSANERFGWEAREFLRSLLVGKSLSFRVLYESGGRAYADLSAPVFNSLVAHVVDAGWAKLRSDATGKPAFTPAVAQELDTAQLRAQKAQRGLWAPAETAVSLQVTPIPPDQLYGSGRQIPSIVERVVAGDRIQLRTMMDADDHYVGAASLAGIRAPRTTEPAGEAARQFVAARLLQRNQTRTIWHGPGPNDIPLVTLVHPQGDIAVLLVEQGLAYVAEPQAGVVGSERILALRKAQKTAETATRGLWRLRQQQHVSRGGATEATVVRVVSSDTLVIDTKTETGKTVQLSSTRAPRRGDPEQAPFVAPAREYTRRMLIGQRVAVTTDAVRPASESFEERDLVTMELDGHNVAPTLISAGWATAVRHRRDDTDRSPFLDELLAAEEDAKTSKRGLHGTIPATPVKTVDASESVVRARGFLASLERRGRLPAVVEHVFAGGRLRLLVPSENCSLVTVIDGVRVPRTGEPVGAAALAYTQRHFDQRDVAVAVRQVDKTGAFVSQVFCGKGSQASLAHQLVAAGLARVHEPSATSLGQLDALLRLQDQAQEARKGVWEDYEPANAESLSPEDGNDGVEAAGEGSTGTSEGYQDAQITYVAPDHLCYRLAAADDKFRQLAKDLAVFFGAAANADARRFTRKPKRGDIVVVVPPVTDKYARGRVVSFDKVGGYELILVDSGRTLETSQEHMLPLPAQFSLVKIPELSKQTTLRFIHAPPRGYTQPFVNYVEQTTKTRVVVSLAGSLGATIFTEDSQAVSDSLNARIVAEGYASVPVADSKVEAAQPLLELQRHAQEDHVGMWEYGDPRDDDDL